MTEWFPKARFGLFVHWGTYSQFGWEPSWPLVGGIPAFPHCQDLTVEAYYEKALEFAPPPGAAKEWMRLAKKCGMTYAVLTTKHHDGFTLFPSDASTFGVGQTSSHRDLVAEFVAAAREEGLRVGLYYSLPDWHHPDYPAFRDEMRPYSFLGYPRPAPEAWPRFLSDMRAQLTHLLTAYGKIDLLWFDGGWERTPAEWQSMELAAYLRRLQPEIILNDRLPGAGDYDTPEQCVPAEVPKRPWETCMTMNHSWGNVDHDREWKSPLYLLNVLAEVAGAGGNLLLNISPDGQGLIPQWQKERLEAIADWMAKHGDAIEACEAGLAAGQFYGPTTRKKDCLFLFCAMRPQEFVTLRGVHGKRIRKARMLGTNRELHFELRLGAIDRIFGGDPLCDVILYIPEAALDPLLSVIEVQFSPEPSS